MRFCAAMTARGLVGGVQPRWRAHRDRSRGRHRAGLACREPHGSVAPSCTAMGARSGRRRSAPTAIAIVTASEDGTARVWDAARGAELAVLRGHEDRGQVGRVQPRRHAHRHRVATTGRRASGTRRAARRCWCCGATSGKSGRRRSAPMARASSPRPAMPRRACGTRRAAPCRPCCAAMRARSGRRPSAPTARASSPRPGTSPCGSGTSPAAPSSRCCAVTRARSGRRRSAPTATAHRQRVRRPHRAAVGCRRAAREIVALRGHESDVRSAAFSPDGTRIVDRVEGSHRAAVERGERGRARRAARPRALGVLRCVQPARRARRHLVDGWHRAGLGRRERRRAASALRGHDGRRLGGGLQPRAIASPPLVRWHGARSGMWRAAEAAGHLRGHEGEVRSPVFSPDADAPRHRLRRSHRPALGRPQRGAARHAARS